MDKLSQDVDSRTVKLTFFHAAIAPVTIAIFPEGACHLGDIHKKLLLDPPSEERNWIKKFSAKVGS